MLAIASADRLNKMSAAASSLAQRWVAARARRASRPSRASDEAMKP